MFTHRPPVAPRGAPSLPQITHRRRPAPARSPHQGIAWAGSGSEPAQEVLRNTLRSACEVIGANRGFVLQTGENAGLEVACSHQIRPRELLDMVLGRAARALHEAMIGETLGLADRVGMPLPRLDGSFEENAPAVVALPLDLGARQRGVLCLLRTDNPRALSELDLEILQALAEQAALALRAAHQESALSKLAASLHGFAPRPA